MLAPQRIDQHARRQLEGVAVFFVASAVAAGYVFLAHEPVSTSTLIVLGVGTVIAVSWASMRLVRPLGIAQGLKSFHLGSWWIARLAATFGLTSVAWLNQQPGTAGAVRQEAIPLALGAVAAFQVAWTAGYVGFNPITFERLLVAGRNWALAPVERQLRHPAVPLLVYLVGISARGLQFLTFGYGYLSDPRTALAVTSSATQLIAQLEQFARYGLVLAAAECALRPTHRSKSVFRVLVLSECVFALASGMKEELLWTLLVVFLVFGILRDLPVRPVVVGTVALTILLIFPLNAAYRDFIRGRGVGSVTPTQAISALPTITGDVVGSLSPSSLGDSLEMITQRTREIDNVAIVMQRTPEEIPFAGAARLVTGPLAAAIPRSVWPDKSVVSYGYEFSQEYYGLDASIYSSSAVTVPGDLYRHVGWPGLLGGAFVLGAIIRTAGAVFHPSRDYGRLILYISMFVLLTNLETDVVSLSVSLLTGLPLVLLVTRLSFARGNP